MRALELVTLPVLMERSRGRQEVMIGLLDGPAPTAHPGLGGQKTRPSQGASQEPVPAARGIANGTGLSWQGSWWRAWPSRGMRMRWFQRRPVLTGAVVTAVVTILVGLAAALLVMNSRSQAASASQPAATQAPALPGAQPGR